MGTKIDLVLKEPPMTIIAALKESDTSVLIASDTEGTEMGGIRLQEQKKLYRHSSASLAWGCSGNVTIGIEDFAPWLQSYVWPPKDWRTFRSEATRKLSELNGEQRKLVQLSGARLSKSHTIDCLLVGWLDRPEIYEFGDDGTATSYWEQGFQAVGTGKPHALVAFKTLRVFNITPLQRLKHIMNVVVTTSPECGYPVHIWRVTKDSIAEGIEKEE